MAERAERTGIVNLTRGIALATEVYWATNPWTRLLGLMGRADLPPGRSLILPDQKGIHTHFMRFTIDVVFYSQDRQDGPDRFVMALTHSMAPWRFSNYHRAAAGIIELPAGTLRATGTESGDRLSLPRTRNPSAGRSRLARIKGSTE